MKTIIIAEAGINHNGDINIAKKLIEKASLAGADYIKFQTYNTNLLVSKKAKLAKYQKKKISDEKFNQFNLLKKFELSKDDHFELIDHCHRNKIKFLSSAFDLESLNFLNELDLDFFKIPSGEITNLEYLNKVSSFNNKIILSTGLSNLEEIKNAINIINKNLSKNKITILHCNTSYPTPFKDVNLKAINFLRNELNLEVGYSDHTIGIEVPIAAVSLGASIIEKHFTIDKKLSGPDHSSSLDFDELKSMVKSIRNIEDSLSGNGFKNPSKSELENLIHARKSIHSKILIKKNSIIKRNSLISLRPGDGISPMNIDLVVGKKAKKNINKYEKINLNDIE